MSDLSEKANRLPLLPGVYIMKNSRGEVIYVGKAKKLKNRVTSYFRGEHLPKVEAMVSKVSDFDVIIVKSELEALVLENSLIKQHKPFYNILLKDDKGYPFIRIDVKSEYPDITLSNRAAKDGALYFGPFGARHKTYEIIGILKKAYLLPDCSEDLSKVNPSRRGCLNYHIGNCRGWCMDSCDKSLYKDYIGEVIRVLQGDTRDIIGQTEKQMLEESERLNFEKAAELRDRIAVLKSLGDKQRVFSTSFDGTDAIGFQHGAVCCMSVLKYNNGNLTDKDTELLDEPLEEDEAALSELIRQYYQRPGMIIPNKILVQCDLDFKDELETFLSEYSGHAVKIMHPKSGVSSELVRSALVNAGEEIQRRTSEEQRRFRALDSLGKCLGLEVRPHRIEAYDISNLGNSGIVSGMTVFIDGKKSKKDYRHFKLEEIENQDDYASMYRTVYRRFSNALEGIDSFSELPDLVLIDGGRGQTAIAEKAMDELFFHIPVFGMVKDGRHRTRALVDSAGNEIEIAGNTALFSMIGGIQEETHRFTITFQKKQRDAGIESALNTIPGIGPQRVKKLMSRFGSLKKIQEASFEELNSVLPQDAARSVIEYFIKQESGN